MVAVLVDADGRVAKLGDFGHGRVWEASVSSGRSTGAGSGTSGYQVSWRVGFFRGRRTCVS